MIGAVKAIDCYLANLDTAGLLPSEGVIEQIRAWGSCVDAGESYYMWKSEHLLEDEQYTFRVAIADLEGILRVEQKRRAEWEAKEEKAAVVHEIWAHWMRYFFSRMEGRSLRVEDVERWRRQAGTAYADLTEAEKASDREVAERFLKGYEKWRMNYE